MTTNPLAQAAMVAYCKWDPTTLFSGQTLLSGNDTDLLQLPSLMVTSVSAITVTDAWGNTWNPAVGQAGAVDVVWSEKGNLRLNPLGPLCWGQWLPGEANVAVTWAGGYATIPADLQAALDSISARMPVSGVASSKIGTAQLTFTQSIAEGGLLNVEQMVLSRYKIVSAA